MEQKDLRNYIADCLRALHQTDVGEGTPGERVKLIHKYTVDLWGGAVPADERIVAAFITNNPQATGPIDLWFFSQNRCLVAKSFMTAQIDLQLVPFKAGIRRLRITKNFAERPTRGSRMTVVLTLQDGEERLEAADENCGALETLLREVLLPKLHA